MKHFYAVLGLFLAAAPAAAQNLVPNPGFEGSSGVIVGAVTGTAPDQWRAFAVGGGAIETETVAVAADEIFPGSPATNAIRIRVTGFGADQGFDDDNGRFKIVPGLDHHAEFYVRTGNADDSDQAFNFGFPLFNAGGQYLGMEPGGMGGNTATAQWTKLVAPTFRPSNPAAQGHISWRCVSDGDEDAILIALPQVTAEGVVVFPTDLACARVDLDVQLTWVDHAAYDALKVLRDGAEIASLPPDAAAFTDAGVPDGVHEYQVLATKGAESDGPRCTVSVFRPPPPGTKVEVDLGEIDAENGLVNSVRVDGGDGETTFVVCGPDGDPREARSNWGPEDPTPDFGDPFFYFTVTDPAMKGQAMLTLTAVVYDDPVRAGAGISLQYTNAAATGPGDLPNTFFPLAAPPVLTLAGTDAWVDLTWEIPDAGFRSFQQGAADFRLGVTDGGRVCMDRVEVVFGSGPPPETLFHRGDTDQNGELQLTDAIQVLTFLFLGGATKVPDCLDAADADDNGEVQLTDAIKILGFLFLGAEPPSAPGPPGSPCGPDPTDDALVNADCTYPAC